MTIKAKLAGGIVAAALVLGSMSPAMARPYWGGGWGGGYGGGWGRYHRHDNSGAVVGAILGVGIIAAIAASAANRDRYDRRYDDRRYDPRYDSRDDASRYRGSGYAGENAAVDDCALAARDEGSRDGRFAEVRDITESRPSGEGWMVTGTLDQRDGYRGGGTVIRAFSCSWLDGRANVRLS